MKEFTIYSDGPIFKQGVYDVFVASLDTDKLPLYFVQNRETKVVEFTNEVTQFYKDWLNHFAAPPEVEFPAEAPQLNLDLNTVTKN